MIATSAIFMALASMAVVLRLHLRRTQKFTGSKADDWLIVAALVWLVSLHKQSVQLIAICRLSR